MVWDFACRAWTGTGVVLLPTACNWLAQTKEAASKVTQSRQGFNNGLVLSFFFV